VADNWGFEMNRILMGGCLAGVVLGLSGCGAETAATAAGAAVVKKKELEQAQGVKQAVEQQLEQANQQMQQRADQLKQTTP
jgi:NifU-like protein involved in Fe-S cluster formation